MDGRKVERWTDGWTEDGWMDGGWMMGRWIVDGLDGEGGPGFRVRINLFFPHKEIRGNLNRKPTHRLGALGAGAPSPPVTEHIGRKAK